MTEIAFHFNVGDQRPDRLGYACRLLRKATATGARVLVLGMPPELPRLDQLLWTFAPLEFVAHSMVGAPGMTPDMLALAPIVLAEACPDLPAADVLLNLQDDVPAGFDAFSRVVEIVSLDEHDRRQARLRWKRYTDLGYAITRHDIARQGA